MSTSKNEALYEAVEKMADLMIPSTLTLRPDELMHLLSGYDRHKIVELAVKYAKEDPYLKLRLHIIYTKLKQLVDNGVIP